jgi:hypothetical protein
MAPLRAWIVPKLLKLLSEDADPLSAIIEKGGDVQILHVRLQSFTPAMNNKQPG